MSGFPRRPQMQKTIAQIQQEKIEQLEQRIVELEVQCFGNPLKTAKEPERSFYIHLVKNPPLAVQVELLAKHFGLEFYIEPEKTRIKESP
jgi:hypothetical protein